MPRNDQLHKILLIGSGPIVIGQGCEFDYSGVQACKALREEGYEVVLVNSNPATIMTDPEFADRTYIEPITPEVIEAILEREKPDAILPTMGGQTALNAAMELNRNGALARHNVQLIGANAQAIAKGEDRQLFKEAMLRIGLDVPRSGIAHSLDDAERVADEIGTFPLIIRPAFTLGGTGGGIAYNREELEDDRRARPRSLARERSPDRGIAVGWKEFEMEVMRDRADNCVVICSIENFDPMGVHTGDSITVAPAQTLTDQEYQMMRDASFAVIREIGVETGGSNIQFAVNPDNGRMVVIEMNPRVSRSSALASKATGFPIAKIAAKLAVGYTLDEIRNDITRETPACFEPTIDYCVVKVPRFTFEKFPASRRDADDADEKRRRSDGDRAHVQGSAAKSAAQSWRSSASGLRRRQRNAGRCGNAAAQAERPERGADFLSRPGLPGRDVDRGDLRADEDRSLVSAEHRSRSWRSNGAGSRSTSICGERKSSGFPIVSSPIASGENEARNPRRTQSRRRHSRLIGWSIPARRSSKPTRRITIRPTGARTRCAHRARSARS